jgi:predicted enzyme related to lactoylglutathione lyase
LFLLENAEGSIGAGNSPRTYARHWTPVHLDVVVPDLGAALAQAVAAGAVVEHPPRDAAYGRIAVLADPFGHGLCLIEFRGRGYDEIAPPVQAA